jgi:hypothetical protein
VRWLATVPPDKWRENLEHKRTGRSASANNCASVSDTEVLSDVAS